MFFRILFITLSLTITTILSFGQPCDSIVIKNYQDLPIQTDSMVVDSFAAGRLMSQTSYSTYQTPYLVNARIEYVYDSLYRLIRVNYYSYFNGGPATFDYYADYFYTSSGKI